jgi:hypothetical protein
MKPAITLLLIFSIQLIVLPQANYIQSIDFDSQQRTVFGLSGFYDSSYAKRYKDGNLESWNLTEIFNRNFLYVSTAVDQYDNIWAYMQDKLYKYDGSLWSEYDIPSAPVSGQKYSDLSIYNNHLWLTTYTGGIYHDIGAYKLNLSDMIWQMFNSSNSVFPSFVQVGKIFHTGDSTWIGTNKGLVLIYNDVVSVELDTTITPLLPTQAIYCYFEDSNKNRWLGTFNYGLVKWVDNSTFIAYNSSNTDLPNNFINAIAEDSEGNLWLATDAGFAVLKNNNIISYAHLNNNGMVTLAVDEEDKIWLGEMGTGELLMFDGNILISVTNIKEETEMPVNFSLFQNYPNPFNPTTKIKFSIPKSGTVQIKVYDLLGKEITTLVNEYKLAGTYELDFDAASPDGSGQVLPSGVYFYRMISGSYYETKKMMILR